MEASRENQGRPKKPPVLASAIRHTMSLSSVTWGRHRPMGFPIRPPVRIEPSAWGMRRRRSRP